jgi:hypothetical protein
MNILEHNFLNYKKAIINFIFSFSWDVTKYSFDDIKNILCGNNDRVWKVLPLYKRPLCWVNDNVQASYHPTIVSDNLQVIYHSNKLEGEINVIIPIKKIDGIKLKIIEFKEITCRLSYDIRIFENGTGTCTFSFLSTKTEHNIDFEKILLIQHLATSITPLASKSNAEDELLAQKHLTHSYIKASSNLKEKFKCIQADHIYLAELFTFLLNSFETLNDIVSDKKSLLFLDKKIKIFNEKKNWQNPYVITILEVDKSDLASISENQDRLTTKEIGAIAVRLTCDNSEDPREYFKSLRREYVYKSLGYYISPREDKHNHKIWLRNYSHYDNLFYTFGRRAAIAITVNFESHPSYYAIPTFVNIIEILRSRWHLGTIANLKLDETFERIAHRDDINRMIDEIFKCRILYGLFLQNPTPYLFDSGAVTEISDSAENVFWLSRISYELEKKLAAIDRLVDVKFSKASLKKFL